MNKLDMKTSDLTDKNIEKIKELFPNVITEKKDEEGNIQKGIDFDLLKQELQKEIVEDGEERYRLDWPGKKRSILKANTPITKTLRPVREDSKDFDNTENLYIEGDNFEVLKILQESYLNKVKMIYIDPPYNTGKDFIYPDDFKKSKEEYEEEIGVEDEKGVKLFKNTDTNGRFHSDWLSMMYERLVIARDLLKDDGVIFISIDDNEVHNLRKICDEIFGEENFIDCIIWKKRYGGGSKEKHLVSIHEYVLFYAKSITEIPELFIPLKEKSVEKYYKGKDEKIEYRGPYRTHPLEAGKAMDARPNLVFGITAPDGTLITPKKQWLWSKERVREAVSKNELEFIKTDKGWSVHTKQYLKDNDGIIRSSKSFSIIDDVYSQHGTNEILEIFGNAKIFPYPKPTFLLKQLFQIENTTEDEMIILDFFAGSSSTADAIFKMNAGDARSRKFILIQLPELTEKESEANKAGYKTISEIGKERIRRAGEMIKKEELGKLEKELKDITEKSNQKKLIKEEDIGEKKKEIEKKKEHIKNLDIGFRVYKTDSTNMKDVYYHPSKLNQLTLGEQVVNIKEDRTTEDLLTQVMLDLGLTLDLPIEKKEIKGKAVYIIDKDALVACFDDNIDIEIINEITGVKPLKVVFKDSSFKDDKDRINVETKFKELSPETEITVI